MPCVHAEIRNPKRGRESRMGRAGWYEYYAGFSTDFVEDALRYTAPRPSARILDPWNASGTTTEIASSLGFEALGFDLNPVMVIVAKARLLDATAELSLRSLLADLVTKARLTDYDQAGDPLDVWFNSSGVAAFRKFERAIQTLLIDPHDYQPLFSLKSLLGVSSLGFILLCRNIPSSQATAESFSISKSNLGNESCDCNGPDQAFAEQLV